MGQILSRYDISKADVLAQPVNLEASHGLEDLRNLWEQLLPKIAEKGTTLQALILAQFIGHHCDQVSENSSFLTTKEFDHHGLEHVQVHTFAEFQKDTALQVLRITEANELADKLFQNGQVLTIIFGKTIMESLKEQIKNCNQQEQEPLIVDVRKREAVHVLYEFRIQRSVYVDMEKCTSREVLIDKVGDLHFSLNSSIKAQWKIEIHDRMVFCTAYEERSNSALNATQQNFVDSNSISALEKFKASQEVQLAEMNQVAIKLVSSGHTGTASKIQTQMNDLNNKWICWQSSTAVHANQLRLACEIQRFHREVDETIDWIQKEDAVLNSDDLWKGSLSARTLLGKCVKLERHIQALEDKVKRLYKIANRLARTHLGSAGTILAKQQEINEHWRKFKAKAESRDLQRFLNDYNDKMTFINKMVDRYSIPFHPSDFIHFHLRLFDYHEYEVELETQKPKIRTVIQFGHQLLESSHYASPEIKEKLQQLKQNFEDFLLQYFDYHRRVELLIRLHYDFSDFYAGCENWKSGGEMFPLTSVRGT